MKIEPNEELRETRELVSALRHWLENYVVPCRGTGYEELTKAAAKRVEESLRGCLERATDELTTPATDTAWIERPAAPPPVLLLTYGKDAIAA